MKGLIGKQPGARPFPPLVLLALFLHQILGGRLLLPPLLQKTLAPRLRPARRPGRRACSADRGRRIRCAGRCAARGPFGLQVGLSRLELCRRSRAASPATPEPWADDCRCGSRGRERARGRDLPAEHLLLDEGGVAVLRFTESGLHLRHAPAGLIEGHRSASAVDEARRSSLGVHQGVQERRGGGGLLVRTRTGTRQRRLARVSDGCPTCGVRLYPAVVCAAAVEAGPSSKRGALPQVTGQSGGCGRRSRVGWAIEVVMRAAAPVASHACLDLCRREIDTLPCAGGLGKP
eukprot:scaffold5293_cov114-Isochrysis_galbana.AAC.5